MHNAFLVIRTVLFALLMYFHVLILVFASWNIAAAKSSGISAPGASAFLLMNAIFIFVLVPMAYLAELICPKARPAHVRVECAWTMLLSIFQLASVDVTVNGPPVHCQTHLPWAMCASSSLLAHTSWLATLIILSYCTAIYVASTAHAVSLPDIWVTPVPHIPWFSLGAEAPVPVAISHLSTHKHPKTSSSSSESEAPCAVSEYIVQRWEKLSHTERQPISTGPVVSTRHRQSVDRPTWARQHRIRRGVDNPFAKPLPKRKESLVVVAPPPRTHRRAVTSWDYSVTVSEQLETTSARSYSTLGSRTPPVFPQEIVNPDLPIPRPSLSEWVRADTVSEIAAHTAPISLR